MVPRSLLTGALGALLWAASGHATAAGLKRSTVSTAGAPLFESEKVQLTEQTLSHLSRNESALFNFGNNGSALSTRSSGECRLMPGDFSWPLPIIWELFDDLLGGALIKTVPLASSCYSSWAEYDSNQCDAITSNWTNSNLQ